MLSDPDKRKQYDALGANWEAFSRAGAGAGGDPFAGFAGFGGRRAARRGQAGNVRYEFRVERRPRGVLATSSACSSEERAALPTWPAPGSGAGRAGGSAGTIDLEDFLAGMGAGVQSGRGRATSSPARPAAKPGHEAHAEITLDEAFHGTTRLVDVDGKRLEVTIPPGASTPAAGSA